VLLAERGELDALTGRADAGDNQAAWRFADVLALRGNLDTITALDYLLAGAPDTTAPVSRRLRAEPAAPAASAGIGTEVQDGSFAFTVTDVETGAQALGDSFLRTEAQGMYVLVHVTVRNIGTESETFMGANQTLLDTQGREFTTDSAAAVMNVPDSESFFTPINPGNSVEGVLVFDVPEGLSPAAIELHESMFSSGALVTLAG
jgi:hypothetical protein